MRARNHCIEIDPKAAPPQVQLRAQIVAALDYVVKDRAPAMLLLSAGHTGERLTKSFVYRWLR